MIRKLCLILSLSLLLVGCGGKATHLSTTWQRDGQTWVTYLAFVTSDSLQPVALLPADSRYGFNAAQSDPFDYAFPPVLAKGQQGILLATRVSDATTDNDSGQHVEARIRTVGTLDPLVPLLATSDVVLEKTTNGVRLSFTITGKEAIRDGEPASATNLVIGLIFHDADHNILGGLGLGNQNWTIAAGEQHTYVAEDVPLNPALIGQPFDVYAYDLDLLTNR